MTMTALQKLSAFITFLLTNFTLSPPVPSLLFMLMIVKSLPHIFDKIEFVLFNMDCTVFF